MTPSPSSPPPTERNSSQRPQWLAFVSMGLTVAIVVALGVVLGVLADGWLHTAPLFLFVGLVAGCGLATWLVVVQVRRSL
jgi:F0F1-type ATP synthase assembly protein I